MDGRLVQPASPLVEKGTVAGAAVFTAFVAASTMAVSAFVAATGGFFNVGEIMVYAAALLMGPYVGAFAGGVGSMLADVSLGYTQFAPGTLIIKATEGFIVGYLGRLALKGLSRSAWRGGGIVVAGIVSAIVLWVGTTYYSSEIAFTLGLPAVGQSTFVFMLGSEFWIGLAVVVFILTAAASFSVEPRVGWLALSILAGGVAMVSGYYVYETLVLGIVGALAEVPFNIAQAMIGLIVSLPLVRSVRRVMGQRGHVGVPPPEESTG